MQGIDLGTWESRFQGLDKQTRDVLLVYLKVSYATHANYMAGPDSEENKVKRDAEVRDLLHLYIQVRANATDLSHRY